MARTQVSIFFKNFIPIKISNSTTNPIQRELNLKIKNYIFNINAGNVRKNFAVGTTMR